MHPDPYIPATRKSGAPAFDDVACWNIEQSRPRPRPRDERLRMRDIIAIILIMAAFLFVLGAAAIVGWDRAEARVTGCDEYRGAEMIACVQERAR